MPHTAELISTGAELLSGRTVNRHAHTLGQALALRGFSLVRDTTVPDDLDQIADAIRGALHRVDLVFISGGLGPTSDDITREGLAAVLGRGIVTDDQALAQLTDRYQRAGREVTAMARRQVLVLEGAEVLQNPVGLAPGQRLEGPEGQTLFVLPGPPREFSGILETHILPWLKEHRPPDAPLLERFFIVGAVPEADVARRLEGAALPPDGITVGFCAAPGRVEVRLNGQDAAQLDACAARVRELLGDDVFAEVRVSMEEAVVHALADRHLTLATVEGVSEGRLARCLMDASESRGVFFGGLVTDRNQLLVDWCGISSELIRAHGAVSEAVACQLAAGVRDQFDADVGLAITDASRGHSDQPDGEFYIAIDDGKRARAVAHRFTGKGDWRAEWVTHIALSRLRRTLGLPRHSMV